MAMRQNYWDDKSSSTVQAEKQFLQNLLVEEDVFKEATLDDTKYFFFTLPSIIIVKAYALGFHHSEVRRMLVKHIHTHRAALMKRTALKIQFKI